MSLLANTASTAPDALRSRSRATDAVQFALLVARVSICLSSEREFSLCCRHCEIWNGGLLVFSRKGAFLFYFELFLARIADNITHCGVRSLFRCCFLIWRPARGGSQQREVCTVK